MAPTATSKRSYGVSAAAMTPSRGPKAHAQAATTPSSAAEALVDALPGLPRASARDDAHAKVDFESARQKFAMYGKRNEHVSHYSPEQHVRQKEKEREKLRQRTLKRQSSGARASTGTAKERPARRLDDWGDDHDQRGTGAKDAASALKNTLLLQENGELAAHLDDIDYHLDGILRGAVSGSVRQDTHAIAQSVIALTKLLQLDQVQAVLKLANQSQNVYARLRDVLLLLRPNSSGGAVDSANEDALQLAIAVMAYTLTLTTDVDEFFPESVIQAVVECLDTASQHLDTSPQDIGSTNARPQNATSESSRTAAEAKTPLKKAFLKRKKSGTLLRRVSSSGDFRSDEVAPADEPADKSRSLAVRDEQLRYELTTLLGTNDAFVVDGQVQLSIVDILGMIVHNILQVGGHDNAPSTQSSFSKAQSTHRHLHQRQDLAGTTFATIIARKRQLIQNQGMDVLLRVLHARFSRLESVFLGSLLLAPVSSECAYAFQRVRTILRVLDQASFLATEVQRFMSSEENIFLVILKLIETLSNVAWGRKSRRKWQSDPSFMHLVVDVLMAALRVLINLSHHNADAAVHIAKLNGTPTLFLAFCKLWGMVQQIGSAVCVGMEDKLVFDALLLILSAITNCIEYSPENRELLSKLDLSTTTLEGLQAFRSSSVCSLLVAFFLNKVDSYLHLIDMSESQNVYKAELESESWVPEDVILGGCTSLLLGCLMKDSSYNSAVILGALPDGSPRLLLRALSAFVALHSQIGALTPEVGQSVLEVEQVFKSLLFSDDTHDSAGVLGAWPDTSALRGPSKTADSQQRGSSQWSVSMDASQESNGASINGKLLIQVKVTSSKKRRADVEEVDDEPQRDQFDTEEQVELDVRPPVSRSPPASAFKLRKFSKVCASVDDSDVDSDRDTARSMLSKSIGSRSASKAQILRNESKSTLTTPARRAPSADDGSRAKSSTARRLKRSRQLVTDLEAEFMRIGSRVSREISAAATSTEDGDATVLDFSQDLSLGSEDAFVYKTPQPQKKFKRIGSDLKSKISTPVVPAKSVEKTPATTHKRKMKATPAKPVKLASEHEESVFDFPE